MLAASVDGVTAIQLLLKHGATIELQVVHAHSYCQVHTLFGFASVRNFFLVCQAAK